MWAEASGQQPLPCNAQCPPLLLGLAVGLGFGALAEVAKKTLRSEDSSGELGPDVPPVFWALRSPLGHTHWWLKGALL